jgi:ATP-dependent protease ClpP protease subunit
MKARMLIPNLGSIAPIKGIVSTIVLIFSTIVCILSTIVCMEHTAQAKTLVLTDKNTVTFRGVVDDSSVAKAQSELHAKAQAGKPLYLVLDTPGGSVEAGISLIDDVKGLGVPVHTVTLFAASMGFQIVQGSGSRYITPMGTLMSHRASGGMEGEFPGQIDNRIAWIKRLLEFMDLTASGRMGITLAAYKEKIRDEYWVVGPDAVRDRAADEVVNVRCGDGLDGTTLQDVETLFGVFKVTMSKCPLIRGPISVDASAVKASERSNVGNYFQLLFSDKPAFFEKYIRTGEFKRVQ